jgi:hypothetical protein
MIAAFDRKHLTGGVDFTTGGILDIDYTINIRDKPC